MKILLVDDNDFSANLLREMLADQEGIEFARAKSGPEAVALFAESAENEYSIILMDIIMKDEKGDVSAQAIRDLDRADAKTVKIYATTALNVDYEVGEGKVFNGAVYKPFHKETLLKIFE